MEFLIIFFSYLVSGMLENNMIIRLFLTIIFSLAGFIGMQATKNFVKEVRENKWDKLQISEDLKGVDLFNIE